MTKKKLNYQIPLLRVIDNAFGFCGSGSGASGALQGSGNCAVGNTDATCLTGTTPTTTSLDCYGGTTVTGTSYYCTNGSGNSDVTWNLQKCSVGLAAGATSPCNTGSGVI